MIIEQYFLMKEASEEMGMPVTITMKPIDNTLHVSVSAFIGQHTSFSHDFTLEYLSPEDYVHPDETFKHQFDEAIKKIKNTMKQCEKK